MTKEEVIGKLKTSLSVEDSVAVFNWFMQNEYPTTVFAIEYPGFPGVELKSEFISINSPKTQQGVGLLNYSIAKIREYYKI